MVGLYSSCVNREAGKVEDQVLRGTVTKRFPFPATPVTGFNPTSDLGVSV